MKTNYVMAILLLIFLMLCFGFLFFLFNKSFTDGVMAGGTFWFLLLILARIFGHEKQT